MSWWRKSCEEGLVMFIYRMDASIVHASIFFRRVAAGMNGTFRNDFLLII